jgi:hypothetical protein
MPPSPALVARDLRILAGHAAGATIPDLAIAEAIDPTVVRRVLRAAGIAPGPIRGLFANWKAARVANSDGRPAEYGSNGAHGIARILRAPRDDRSLDKLRSVR